MLQSIRIEGDILDWDGPVEIELGEVPTILTGRNGSGKTLTGNIIKSCTDYVRNSVNSTPTQEINKQRFQLSSLFEDLGIEKVIFKFNNKIYNQYNNLLMANLPILFTLNPDYYSKHKQLEKECWDIDLSVNIESSVEISFEHSNTSFGLERFSDVKKSVKTIVNQRLIFDGNVDSLFNIEEYEFPPPLSHDNGDVKLDEVIHLKPKNGLLFDEMVHESVIEMKNIFAQYGLNFITFDDDVNIELEENYNNKNSLCSFYHTKNLKNLYELKRLREEIPVVSHHYPDFEFPNTITGWSDERIEHFELKEDIGGFLDVEFISTKRKLEDENIFKNEEDFEIQNYGYFDLSLSWGEKFSLPKADYDPLKLPKDTISEISKLMKTNFSMKDNEDAIFSYKLMLEGEIFDDLSQDVKENLHEFACWHWWTFTVPEHIKTQIILCEEFGIHDAEKLSLPLPSGIENLAYLIETVRNTTNSIIFIDEPEISLHIDWQAKIVEVLRLTAKRLESSLIFTTHSPDIVVNNLQYVYQLPPHSS